MAKASQVVILENEFYIIKAPNGKVLEVKDFNTENAAAIQTVFKSDSSSCLVKIISAGI